MIEAKELRIDVSLVQFKGYGNKMFPAIVRAIGEGVNVEPIDTECGFQQGMKFSHVYPISITPDSLKLLNINLDTFYKETGLQIWKNEFLRIDLFVGKKTKPRFYLRFWHDGQGIICEHIHNLQNLSRFLTGVEIEITKPVADS